jgi:hypothetical protein
LAEPGGHPMKLPTPDCPWCARRTEDRGDHFCCAYCCTRPETRPPLPDPVEWYRGLAQSFGANAELLAQAVPLPDAAYIEARWAARAAMRAVPGLRG